MSDRLNDGTTLLRTFADAADADLAISPMIVVGAAGGDRPWIEAIGNVADALDMQRICYVVTTDQARDVTEWVGSSRSGDTPARAIVLAMRQHGGGDAVALAEMLQAISDHGSDGVVVVVVVEEDQLEMTRDAVGSILSVPAPLVPTCRQGFAAMQRNIRIVGEATMVGRSNGQHYVEASVAEPYAHDVRIEVECDAEDDRTFDALVGFGENFRFAATVTAGNGVPTCRIEDIVVL